MATYLIVLEGPRKGEKIELKGGERIGRERGDIVLADAKVSSLHATIKKGLMGPLMLVDQKSKNGVISDGSRVDKLKLVDGVEFRIGSSLFRVEVLKEKTAANIPAPPVDAAKNDPPTGATFEKPFEDLTFKTSETQPPKEDTEKSQPSLNFDADDDDATGTPFAPPLEAEGISEPQTFKFEQKQPSPLEADDFPSLNKDQNTNETLEKPAKPSISFRTIEAPAKQPSENQAAPEDESGRRTWSQILEAFARENLKNSDDQPQELKPLSPRVKLTFFRGIQAETEWELGYGPRSIGRASIDLPIFEENAPPNKSFEILPSEDGPIFFTKYPQEVQINGQAREKVALKNGDVITIYETQIEVELF